MKTIRFFTPVIPHNSYAKENPVKSTLIQFAENYFNFEGDEAHCLDSGNGKTHETKIVKPVKKGSCEFAQKALKASSYLTLVCPIVALSIKSAYRWNNTFYTLDSNSSEDPVPYIFFSDSLYPPRYNDIQMKAAHNSFDKGSLTSQLTFSKSKPWEGGCLAIELDLVQNPEKSSSSDEWEFSLQHGGRFSPSNRSLPEALREVQEWSEKAGDHPVVTIHFDIKETCFYGDDAIFAKKLDSIIEREIPRTKIITPSDIRKDKESLQEAVSSYGWPELGNINNKFIFVLTGEDKDLNVSRRRTAYLDSSNREDHLAFVDIDQRAISSLEEAMEADKNRIFLNVKLGSKKWEELVTKARKKNLVTRIWKANNEDNWNLCSNKVNIIATDRIFGSPWASL